MTIVHVTYRGSVETRFDRDYYVRIHLPMVRAAWGPDGLLSCDAFFPAENDAGTIAIAECRFRDAAAFDAALASPQTLAVMTDVARFTDAEPVQTFAHPVREGGVA